MPYPSYLGYLGWQDTDRIISIRVTSPKMAKACAAGIFAVTNCQQFLQQTLPM
jgi:hypothetical protein